jgi:hypothetical protein
MKKILIASLILFASCKKEQTNVNKQYTQKIVATFYELDSAESIVVRQTTFKGDSLSTQNFKVNSLNFEAEMSIQNVRPSLFSMYLKDSEGSETLLEQRVLK